MWGGALGQFALGQEWDVPYPPISIFDNPIVSFIRRITSTAY
jgi:hypothetical protein